MRRLGTNWAGIKPKPVVIDGIRFPSKSEGARYAVLKIEERAGLLRGLKVHSALPLVVNGRKIGRGWLEVDFIYERPDGGQWVKKYEDHKAVMTREAQQRLHLAEALHGIKIEITGGKPSRRRRAK